ncbi:hypothetical protein [Spirilliplanes yamanashiensis]|uniref:Uncharacterized protein n=1 Tax=Spirilliplanes yamanashiensis TaxID=42233 RepID=A0A8J4DGK1_9ACTN|nr:hypothetical protein [Spirilliplanes yamanashiensis]MDP9819970.1 hypothetical protein [Spirilliplanes yamanashiensis]GIJ01211.1 hypothetical protein Sya03_05630 [Spirilliplanes yamanashiensis]
MTTPLPENAPSTSSLISSESVTNFEHILEFGKRLSEQLDPGDVLGRWMSHHIAELIIRAESATDDLRDSAEKAASDVIMKLWANRDGAPWRRKPLRDFDEVFAALERLGSETTRWGYTRIFDDQSRPTDEQTSNSVLLAAACDLDHYTRSVVRSVVALAASEAESDEEPWVRVGIKLVEDGQARAIRRLQSLRLRARLRGEESDSVTPENLDLDDHDPILEGLSESLSYAADAFLRIQSRLPLPESNDVDDKQQAD